MSGRKQYKWSTSCESQTALDFYSIKPPLDTLIKNNFEYIRTQRGITKRIDALGGISHGETSSHTHTHIHRVNGSDWTNWLSVNLQLLIVYTYTSGSYACGVRAGYNIGHVVTHHE